MKNMALISVLLLSLLSVFSCSPKEVKSPQDLERRASAPVKEAGQSEWDRVVSEAKKEGRLSVYGPPWGNLPRILNVSFKKAYPGIELEYMALEGRNLAPRVMAERRGSIYLTDIIIAGTTTIISVFKDMAVPIEPVITQPEARDPKAWLGGKFDFADSEGKLNLVFVGMAQTPVLYNTQLVDSKKIEGASYWEFAKPEWKDKLIMNDPRVSGSGMSLSLFFHTTKGLGMDYMKTLVKNGVILHRDHRLMGEWVARGKFMVQLATTTVEPRVLIREGMPLSLTGNFREGTYLAASSGSLILLDKAPHPNASRVFINWFLSREGQYLMSKETELPSLRIDIPTDHLDPKAVPTPGVYYQPNYKEDFVKLRDEIQPQVLEIFGRN